MDKISGEQFDYQTINERKKSMKKINETDALNELILTTEKQRAYELILVKEQFHDIYESLKPANLIKNAFHNMTSSPGIKSDMVNSAIGIGSGLLSKKLLVGNSHNPIKSLVGNVAQFAVANLVSKYSGGIAAVGSTLLQRLFNKKKERL
jgi:hypothetical protein